MIFLMSFNNISNLILHQWKEEDFTVFEENENVSQVTFTVYSVSVHLFSVGLSKIYLQNRMMLSCSIYLNWEKTNVNMGNGEDANSLVWMGDRLKKHQSKTKACMPQDGDRRTKIAQENWQGPSTASFWPVCFKPSVKKCKGVEDYFWSKFALSPCQYFSRQDLSYLRLNEPVSFNSTLFTADEKKYAHSRN